MKLIEISAINISKNRQRQSFALADILDLAASIQNVGLMQPIILRTKGDHYVLVAGERRLRAISNIFDMGGRFRCDGTNVRKDFVPYVLLSDLDELSAAEAEYDENTKRVDLDWKERATATALLESIRKRRAEQSGKRPPTVAELSLEVRGNNEGTKYEQTRAELLVAPHLHRPEIAGAKDAKEALKILKRVEETDRNRELAAVIGKTFTADSHRLFNEDSTEWMRKCPAESFDVILTDPPYGIGADTFGDSGGAHVKGGHAYEDTPAHFEKLLRVFAEQSIRITKAEAHLYLFCDIEFFLDLRLWFTEAGWEVFRTPLIWRKPFGGLRAPWPQHGPQRNWEMCLYGIKGKKQTTKMYGDVLDYSSDDNLGHSAQKPVALFEDLLRRSVRPGDAVLDPFCGTGPIFPAAHGLKCRATGIELDPAAFGIAATRIKELKAQLQLAV